jgi:hypothetical protein
LELKTTNQKAVLNHLKSNKTNKIYEITRDYRV